MARPARPYGYCAPWRHRKTRQNALSEGLPLGFLLEYGDGVAAKQANASPVVFRRDMVTNISLWPVEYLK
jgi:hypothetical protein